MGHWAKEQGAGVRQGGKEARTGGRLGGSEQGAHGCGEGGWAAVSKGHKGHKGRTVAVRTQKKVWYLRRPANCEWRPIGFR